MAAVSKRAARAAALALGALALGTCFSLSGSLPTRAAEEPPHPAALDEAIIAAAKRHGVPEHLIRRIIMRESKYNARARNRAYWGLMQISYPTARSMGFKGTREELLNPIVNLRYAVPYLANAFVVAGHSEDAAVRLYAAGYYFTARSKGLLNILRTADSPPILGVPEPQPVLQANAVAQPPQSIGIFGALFGPGQQPEPARPTQVAAYAPDGGGQAAVPQPGAASTPAAAANTAAPPHTFDGPTVAMVADKKGDLAPPKKWTRDGGMTTIARGEQVPDLTDRRETSPSRTAKARGHHKITLIAALDVPPTTAQAYVGAPGQDPRFDASASQAAIAEAMSGQAATGQPQAAAAPQPQPAASVQPAAVEAAPEKPAAKPTKRVRSVHRRKAPDPKTREARADRGGAEPAASAAPEPSAPAQAAAAPQ